MPIDPDSLPRDAAALKQMLVDLSGRLEKTQRLLRQLLAASSGVRSEQLSADQLRLFAQELGADAGAAPEAGNQDGSDEEPPPAADGKADATNKPRGRKSLPAHLKRERVVHDLRADEKHCRECGRELRRIGEEISERYEYAPAQLLVVVEDACQKYACACRVRTATKQAQPVEKSTAGASLLAQVIVSKVADHLPVHRQAKMLRRHGVEIAVGRSNWTFFGSDRGGRTMAVLRSFVASCELVSIDPFVWFRDVLSRIATHSIQRLDELLPHRWADARP